MANAVSPVNGQDYFGITQPKARSELDMTTFLRLLTTQLANQNPLEPMNDRDFFAQMAQLGTVQGMGQLKESMDITQANSIIGKTVTALRPMSDVAAGASSLVTGKAVQLANKNGTFVLGIQEANGGIVDVTLDSIQSIYDTGATGTLQNMINMANAANLIGKPITAPHPTLKDSTGNPEQLSANVKKVSFEGTSVFLTVTDRLGNDVKVSLNNVTAFG